MKILATITAVEGQVDADGKPKLTRQGSQWSKVTIETNEGETITFPNWESEAATLTDFPIGEVGYFVLDQRVTTDFKSVMFKADLEALGLA